MLLLLPLEHSRRHHLRSACALGPARRRLWENAVVAGIARCAAAPETLRQAFSELLAEMRFRRMQGGAQTISKSKNEGVHSTLHSHVTRTESL